MLKIIGFIFILFSGISLIIIASLVSGIEIDNISYKNINIEKLYLKYDKKLNISTPSISIVNKDSKTTTKIKTSLTIDYNNDLYEITVKEFHLLNTDIKFTGLVYLDKDQIDLNKKSQIMIKNLDFSFDQKMGNVTSKSGFMNYENNIINLSLLNPYYKDVNMSGSKVSYSIDKNILKLYLKTKSLFNDTIKNALKRYDVEIDTIQYDGQNDISANIFIPFDNDDIFIESNVTILDSNLEDYGQKYKVNKSILHYKDKIIQGKVNLHSYNYQDINITNSILNYKINLNKGFEAEVNSDKLNLDKDQIKFNLNNVLLNVNDNKLTITSNITDETNKLYIDFKNKTNLNTKELDGQINVKYIDKENNTSLQSDDIFYKGSFKDSLELTVKSNDITLFTPKENIIKNLSLHLKDNIVKTNFSLIDLLKSNNINIHNKTDLNKKISYGNIDIDTMQYQNLVNVQNKNIPYNISFKDSIVMNLPLFGLTYFKPNNSLVHKLLISNPNKLLEAFTFMNVDKTTNGFIDIESENLSDTKVHINNINFDINSTYFDSKNNNKRENLVLPQFPKIQLLYTDSQIKYDNLTLPFQKLNLNTNKDILNLNIIDEKSFINLKTKGNNLSFNATNLSDKYVNTFLNKKILEDGYINLNIYGDDINNLSGDINFHKTTIKNVTIVNSLLTFVNTTPAIFNPLLALPTLFRLAETGFDTNGYYMKWANGSFRYNLPSQQLDVYDLYTNGKMSNFIVNSHQNLQTKEIKANVDISFLKDFTKAIRHIPVVGYIIMGADGEFHTSVDISGTTANPILETNTIQEATSGVSGVFKRILTLPLQPFKIETTGKQRKDHNKRVQELLK